ncbi:MAG: hypothetical protein ACRD2J_03930 [Thermoanaerobaculia bacterium]
MRFLVECIRLADDEGIPVRRTRTPKSFFIIDGETAESALQGYLARDGFEPIGSPSVLPGPRTLLTVRQRKALFAIHVSPFEPESSPAPPEN